MTRTKATLPTFIAVSTAASRRGDVRAASLFLGLLPIVTAASWVGLNVLGPGVGKSQFGFNGGSLFGGWAQWDAGWYYGIANDGYRFHQPGTQSPVAFFPGYPMAMRLVGRLVGDHALAGVFVTIGCGLTSAVLFWRWCRDRMDGHAAGVAVVALLVYPYSYYLYGAMYGTALFLCATLVAFLAVERDHLLIAGLAGALATGTRLVGLAVVAGLVVCVLERRGALDRPGRFGIPRRIDLRVLTPRDGLVLLSGAGFASYAGFLWVRFGDPLLFASVQRHWEQPPGAGTWLKVEFVEQLLTNLEHPFTWGLAGQGLIAGCFAVLVPFVGRQFGWGYAVYVAVLVALPLLGSKDFQGLGRYMIGAFPAFAAVGLHLTHRPQLRPAFVAVSLTGLLLMAAGFGHGLYLS